MRSEWRQRNPNIPETGFGATSVKAVNLPPSANGWRVRTVGDQPSTDAILVSAFITLAKSLGLATVAEGVETEAQRCILAEKGCDTFRGFLFSHPLPLDGFERFLRHAMPNG